MGSQPGQTSEFRASVPGGELVGRIGGAGPDLLLLHGGPVSNYLEPLADELRDGYRVATYQQRGLRVNAASAGPTLQSAIAELPGLASRLAGSQVPTVFVHGSASPMPVTASTDTAEVIGAAALVTVVPNAGHFMWMDVPGCLRQPLDGLRKRAGQPPRVARSGLSR